MLKIVLRMMCFAFLCHSKTLEDTALVKNPRRPFGQHCYNLEKVQNYLCCAMANGLFGNYDENLMYVIA
jgi:hypothetical protein